MKQHLAVSAIGSDRTGMVHELTRVISECGGNISESRMANLGSEFAMLLLVSGNWHALAKLETELKRLAEGNNLSIHLKRTEPRSARTDMLPYSIDVVCLDQSGIVSGLSGFFATRGIDIAEVSTRSYPAAHTGAPMFSVQMIVNVPSRIHVAQSSRRVHGVLRLSEPRCDSRTRKVVIVPLTGAKRRYANGARGFARTPLNSGPRP
ncbi:MAG: ACT domain-containing protein [Gammaproteobacteria bacterium]